MERKSIGTFIAALRRASGMTQKELAEKLSVSDKAVSRWERDESLPDLLLLPVIADTFHITVDELLRGERKAQTDASEREEADSAAANARLHKQTKRVLTVQMNRLRNRICIALGVGMLGLLGAVICNFGFSRGFLAACVGSLCVGAAAVMTVFFAQGAWQAADDEDYDAQRVHEYRVQVIQWCKRMAVMLTGMLAICLTPAVCIMSTTGLRDVYLEAGAWLRYGMVSLSVAATALSAVLWHVNGKLQEKELLPKGTNVSLHGWCVGVLSTAMALTLLVMWIVPQSNIYRRGKGTTYTSLEEFKQAMDEMWQDEQENGTDGMAYGTYYRADGTEMTAEEFARSEIRDQDGNVVLEYLKPLRVYGLSYSVNDEHVHITVYQEMDYVHATIARDNVLMILTLLLVAEPIGAYGAYVTMQRARRKL